MVFLEKKFSSILPLCMVVCLSLIAQVGAAERVIWDENGVNVRNPPNNIFSYEYKGNNATVKDVFVYLDTAGIEDAPYYIKASFEAEKSAKGGAGFGFYWDVDADYDPRVSDLSGFGGVCLNYSATKPVRLDFMQSTINDDNYFGIRLPSTDGQKVNKFVAFEDLELGWDKGKSANTWNAKKQLGLQFSYKAELANKFGQQNEVGIFAVRIADECPQHAPEANPDLDTAYDLNEGERLVFHMADVFRDLDGDSLSISGTFSGNGDVISLYDDTQHITLKDSIVFTVNPNPSSDLYTVKLVATDPTGRKATWTFTITPINVEHVPTLRDTTFEVTQGDTLTFKKEFSFYNSLAYDLDGDEIVLVYVDGPEGLDFNVDKGVFTYVAPADSQKDIEVHFSLCAVEVNNPESVSDTVEYTIIVRDVNDPPTVTVVESDFDYYVGDINGTAKTVTVNDSTKAIGVDEDFTDTLWIEINPDNLVFSDVDSKFDMKVKTNGIVNAKIVSFQRTNYIEITAKKDANGLAKISYNADDGEFQVGVNFYVKVAAVDDPPVAKDDKYDAVQDSTIKVAVKKGVLANDVNPDDAEVTLKAKLKDDVEHGKLTLSEDGSFKYEADATFRGKVTFTYVCVNENDVESEPATVTINVAAKNMAPVVREGVADSLEEVLATLEEDKVVTAKSFKIAVVKGWFEDPDDDPLTVDAVNEDGKLKVSVTATSITISPEKDSCGASEVTFIVADSLGAETKLTVPVQIKPVNDAPALVSEGFVKYSVATSDWELKIDLDSLVYDIDGDSLTYSISKNSSRMDQFLDMKIKGSVFTVKPQKIGLDKNRDYDVTVEASDGEAAVKMVFTFSTGKTGLWKAALVKTDWRSAIAADRGMAAMMDMQGRVMWKAKLPVSEADVRNAATAVQGRKVLRVNNQTWTIK